jgi:hypothetical protein
MSRGAATTGTGGGLYAQFNEAAAAAAQMTFATRLMAIGRQTSTAMARRAAASISVNGIRQSIM